MGRVTVDPSFWSDRRVLVTGHTGFKGAWLSLWLAGMGARVHGFALAPQTEPALFHQARVAERINSIEGDLRDLHAVRNAVHASAPEIVLHLAAQALVIDSMADPVGTMATNVMGTAHLLQALRAQSGVATILVVTSDKVYANDGSGDAFSEEFPLGGKDPYSASKAATELVVRAWRETYLAKAGVRIATARGGNVIGGGDYAANRIVPDVVRSMAAGTRPVLRMPNATRPWQHVLDCLSGYLQYAQALSSGATVPTSLNFGPEPIDAITVGDVATSVLTALGSNDGYEHQPAESSVEMKTLAVDAALARTALGWHDRLPGYTGIEWTAAWYKRAQDGEDPLSITLDQIETYNAL